MSREKLTLAVDLDGVLAHYDGWKGIHHIGDPIPGAIDFCANLSEKYNVVINTSRCNLTAGDRPENCTAEYLKSLVVAWLDKHGFKYHDVYTGQGKIISFGYVDDRAITCRPLDRPDNDSFEEYDLVLKEVDYLANYTSTKEKDKDFLLHVEEEIGK